CLRSAAAGSDRTRVYSSPPPPPPRAAHRPVALRGPGARALSAAAPFAAMGSLRRPGRIRSRRLVLLLRRRVAAVGKDDRRRDLRHQSHSRRGRSDGPEKRVASLARRLPLASERRTRIRARRAAVPFVAPRSGLE